MDLPILKIFAGSSHPYLGQLIAKEIKLPLSQMYLKKFASGELYARPEETVRGCNVFIVQTATHNVNEELMELFIMIDALKRSFAKQIHVIMPHYGYARQDRVSLPREPISAKLVADLISSAGADHLITLNLHSAQEQGFFNFPVDNVTTDKLFAEYFRRKHLKKLTVVSPDAGGAKKAKWFSDLMGANLAIIYKSRPAHNKSVVTHVVGEVKNRTCILYDDMIDTGGSVINAKEALIKEGADRQIYLAATHPIFSGNASEKVRQANFAEVVITDSIPVPQKKRFRNLKILSVAPLLAHIMRNVHHAKSVSGIWS